MATYNTAFGSLPGYNEMLGTTNTTGGGQQQTYGQAPRQRQPRPFGQQAQTFAQLQQQGVARPPAPSAPQAQAFEQYGGSQQGQQMRQQLQQQLQEFGKTPSRYDTQAFQQIRGAQAANLQAEYGAQQKALNEELARRGLSASSVGGGRMGDLAGQQARALAGLDAQLLQQAAETQAADRAQLLQAGQGFAELAGAQDLAQFEANRVAQAATFENQLRAAQFGQQQFESMGQQALQAGQAAQSAQQFQQELGLRLGELTGQVAGAPTLAAQQQAEQRRQFDIQQALQQQLGLGGLGIQQQQVGLEAQRVANQAAQFGLSLNEQQAARMQQYGISLQDLQLETQRVQNQASQFGQTLSAQQAQNTAQNNLEQQRIDESKRQFTISEFGTATPTGATTSLRAQQLQQQLAGITGTYGGALTQEALQNAYARAAQLSQVTGKQYTVNPATGAVTEAGADTLAAQLQRAEMTGSLGGVATLEKLQQGLQQAQALSQITGVQYTVDAAGNPVRGATSSEAARQFDVQQRVQSALGLSETSGFVYNPFTGQLERTAAGAPQETVQGQIARSQMLMSLVQSLGSLDPTKLAELFKTSTSTSSSSSSNPPSTSGEFLADSATTYNGQPIPDVLTPPTGAAEGSYARIGGKLYRLVNGRWVDRSGAAYAPAGQTGGTSTSGTGTTGTGTTGTGSTTTTTTSSDFYAKAATGANVPADTLNVLKNITAPSPTGVYMHNAKYWQNAGSGWYEVAIVNGQWTRI